MKIQQVIANCRVSDIEARETTDFDVRAYVHHKTVVPVKVALTPELNALHMALLVVLQASMDRLAPFRILPVTVAAKVWSFTFIDLMQRADDIFSGDVARDQKGALLHARLCIYVSFVEGFAMSYLSVCSRLSSLRDQLLCYGVKTFQNCIVDFVRDCTEKRNRATIEVTKCALLFCSLHYVDPAAVPLPFVN